jgi:hypothetical protein
MPATFDFPPFDIQLLKLAAERASTVAKAAKKAASNAYLTEAESEAHELEGYADEAVRFLDNPNREPTGDDDAGSVVELATGHRRALRVGCLILIKESEKIIDKQEEMFADTDGQGRRMTDFKRLEQRLRSELDPQQELPMDEPKPDADSADAEETDEEVQAEGGPFDAPSVSPRLSLMSGESGAESPEIPDADFEFLDDDDDDDETGAPLSLVPDDENADETSDDDASRVE